MELWFIILIWTVGGFLAGWLGCLVVQAITRAGRT
jgi:hypothetical protein